MVITFTDFCKQKYNVSDACVEDAKKAFEFLSEPSTVYKMLVSIDMGFPPINAICKQVEQLIDCSNIHIRQVIGREMKYILGLYGYKETDERERIRKNSLGKYFRTGPKYIKDKSFDKEFTFEVKIISGE